MISKSARCHQYLRISTLSHQYLKISGQVTLLNKIYCAYSSNFVIQKNTFSKAIPPDKKLNYRENFTLKLRFKIGERLKQTYCAKSMYTGKSVSAASVVFHAAILNSGAFEVICFRKQSDGTFRITVIP